MRFGIAHIETVGKAVSTVWLVLGLMAWPSDAAADVAVCLGKYAYAYHDDADCYELGNCKGQVRVVSQHTAESAGRRPCCQCMPEWHGCARDSSKANDSALAALIVATVLAAVGTVLISNEIYFAPALSLRPSDHELMEYPKSLVFQLRKHFSAGALGLGLELKEAATTHLSFADPDHPRTVPVSFTHHNLVTDFAFLIHHDETRTLGFFAGPVIRLGEDPGFGGMLGGSVRPFGRLRFDVRYELGTGSHLLQVGVGLIYQKQSYWWSQAEDVIGP